MRSGGRWVRFQDHLQCCGGKGSLGVGSSATFHARYLDAVVAHAVLAMSYLSRWWNDPVATSTVFTALGAGGFALYRFRFIPSERRRETLDAMQKAYGHSTASRGIVLPEFPPFLLNGRDTLHALVVSVEPMRPDLRDALKRWIEPTNTAAHEIVSDEAKFRSLLLAIFKVRRFQKDALLNTRKRRLLDAATTLVTQLNDFAQLVELDLFSQSDVLGHLHRSLAPACKAVEPLIWARNL